MVEVVGGRLHPKEIHSVIKIESIKDPIPQPRIVRDYLRGHRSNLIDDAGRKLYLKVQ